MTDDLVVQRVAFFHTVDDATLLLIGHTWNLCDGLVLIYIEVLALGVYLLHAQSGQRLQELLIDQFHAFGDCGHVLCLLHGRQSTLEVIHNGKKRYHS